MKKVVAVEPRLEHKEADLHEISAFNAWKTLGGATCGYHIPPRWLIPFLFHFQLPHIYSIKKEARVKFISGFCPAYMGYPDYLKYEIIPLVWDCWPGNKEKVKLFFKRNDIKVAYFTSSQMASVMQSTFPNIHIKHIPEGIDCDLYSEGTLLSERKIDVLEYGRNCSINLSPLTDKWCVKRSTPGKRLFLTNKELFQSLADTKITFCLPRSLTHPELAGNIETLTQRYWECMLSRIVIIGKAPKELTDILGYNPVIEINWENPLIQIETILNHIEDYQDFVNNNRDNALKYGSWLLRMRTIIEDLSKLGYVID